jgi:hypothetical protein
MSPRDLSDDCRQFRDGTTMAAAVKEGINRFPKHPLSLRMMTSNLQLKEVLRRLFHDHPSIVIQIEVAKRLTSAGTSGRRSEELEERS